MSKKKTVNAENEVITVKDRGARALDRWGPEGVSLSPFLARRFKALSAVDADRLGDAIAHALERRLEVVPVHRLRRHAHEPREKAIRCSIYRQIARPADEVRAPRKRKARPTEGVRHATIGGRLVAVTPNVTRAR